MPFIYPKSPLFHSEVSESVYSWFVGGKWAAPAAFETLGIVNELHALAHRETLIPGKEVKEMNYPPKAQGQLTDKPHKQHNAR